MVLAGQGVDDGGQELAAQDLLGPQVGRRRCDGAVEEPVGVVEDRQLVALAGHVGQGERRPAAAARPADPLHVGGDRGRQGAEHDGGQVPDVDAHLQGGGGHQDIGVARRLLGALEPVLDPGALVGGEQRGVLVGVDAAHMGPGVHAAVEALRRALPGPEAARAADGRAGGVVELVHGGGRGGQLRAAGVAHQEQVVSRGLAQRGDDDAPGRQPVDGAAAAGVGGGEDPGLGQAGQEHAGQAGGVGGRDPQALAGPGGVPGPGRAHRHESRLAGVEAAARPGEGGGGAPGGEGRLALVAVALVPDPQALAVVALVAREPLVVDGPVAAHALQGAAHPGEQVGVGDALESVQDALPLAPQGPAGQVGQGGCVPGGHVHAHRPGGLQGAPVGGLEAHLQGDVEQEPTAHVRLGPAPLGGRDLRVPVGLEAPVLGQGRGYEPVAVEGAGPGGVEGGPGPRVKGHVGCQRPPQGRAQAHGVGALVDESCPVGGVLHGVGEDEGALVGGVEGVVAEQGGQGHRQEGGDGRAEEADRVPVPARGAHVAGGVLGDGALVPGQGQDRQHEPLLGLRVVIGRAAGEELAAVDGVPAQPGVAGLRVGLPGLEAAAVVGVLPGGVQEGPEAGVAGLAVAAHLGLVVLLPLPRGGQHDAPAGAPARAAVQGRARGLVDPRLLGGGVGPAEGRQGAQGPVDAGDLADPQGDLHIDRAAVGGAVQSGAHDGQGRQDRAQHPAGRARLAGGAQQVAGEPGQRRGDLGGAHEVQDVRVGLEGAGESGGVEGVLEPVGQVVQAGDDAAQQLLGVGGAGLGEVGQGPQVLARQGAQAQGAAGQAQGLGGDVVGGGPPVEVGAGLGDDGVGGQVDPEDVAGEGEHPGGVPAVAEGGGGGHRAHGAERGGGEGLPARVVGAQVGAQGQAQAPQQHGDVGALGAVVGVELIQDQVGQ